MNPMGEQSNIEPNDPKTKLNQLSKYIFDIIYRRKEELVQQFRSVKEETLKRRKYDTVNILINCDIITSKRVTGGFSYRMKHDVPNSVRDLEMIKNQATQRQTQINRKKKILQKMKMAEENYLRLIKLNEIRPKNQQTSIMLPLIVVDRKYSKYIIKPKNNSESVEIKFCPGATYISNLLAEGDFFIF